MPRRPCLDCGEATADTRCRDCATLHATATEARRGSARQRGYTTAWDRLSRRARRLQRFCTDCARTDDLQLDHLTGAWQRVQDGKPLRLGLDVEVVCGPCNRARGAARGAKTRGRTPPRGASGPTGEADFQS